jgi:hypothetical protein
MFSVPKTRLVAAALLAALVFGTLGLAGTQQTRASSHREAPLISTDPQADNTDLYAFISPDAPDTVTIVANFIPFEHPDGAPNYYAFSDDVQYEINIDNVGDALSHVSYRFKFNTTTVNPATFLYATGPISSLTDPDFNVRQTFTISEGVRPIGSPVTTYTEIGTNLLVPPINVGSKSTPNYDTLIAPTLNQTAAAGAIKVFAGPRDDPFWVDLGAIFDVLSLRPQNAPIGYPMGPTVGIDSVSGFNVHSIVLQVPITRLMSSQNDPVIGIWSTASRRSTRVLNTPAAVLTGAPGATGLSVDSGPFVQVSRLGMPLTNEVVLPRALKDAFNGLDPSLDYPIYSATAGSPPPFNDPNIVAAGAALRASVLDPELQRLLNALYGVPNPGNNRVDLQEIFLQGMTTDKPFPVYVGSDTTPTMVPAGTNVNAPTKGTDGSGAGIVPAEMLRLNTASAFRPGVPGSLCKATPDYNLGLLGGDVCGFPNGRRLQDDATRIELLAVAGAAYSALTPGTFNFDAGLIPVLTDGTTHNDKAFLGSFPYVPSPHQGQEWDHQSIVRSWLTIIVQNAGGGLTSQVK